MPEQTFKLGDLIWAKMTGFSPWPGRVSNPIEYMKKPNNPKNGVIHCIYFFGSNNYGWIDESNIKPYQEHKGTCLKLSKTAAFKEACEAIEKFIADGEVFEDGLDSDLLFDKLKEESNTSIENKTPEIKPKKETPKMKRETIGSSERPPVKKQRADTNANSNNPLGSFYAALEHTSTTPKSSSQMEEPVRIASPDGFRDIPVFHPTIDEFQNFQQYYEQTIYPEAFEFGGAKIIPPQEWRDAITVDLKELENQRIITNPVLQRVKRVDSQKEGLYEYKAINWIETEEGKKWRRANRKVGKTEESQDITLSLNEYLRIAAQYSFKFANDEEFWQLVDNEKLVALYGTDVNMTLMNQDTAGSWNLHNLAETTLLGKVLDRMDVEGIRNSRCHFATTAAFFAPTTENVNLPTINFLHKGCNKNWFMLSAAQGHAYEKYCGKDATELTKGCDYPFRHNSLFVNPHMLRKALDKRWDPFKITRATQKEGEIMITFPYSFHWGYNDGPNVAEAAKFATPSWIPYGITAQRCTCSNAIRFPMDVFVAEYCGIDFMEKWLNLSLTEAEKTIQVPQVGSAIIINPTDVDISAKKKRAYDEQKIQLQRVRDKRDREKILKRRKEERDRKRDEKNLRKSADGGSTSNPAKVIHPELSGLSRKAKKRKLYAEKKKKKQAQTVSEGESVDLNAQCSSQPVDQPNAQ